MSDDIIITETKATELKKAYVAGGCFWGLEDLLKTRPGIVDTEVGYCGGQNANPTYEHHPGHAEAVEITYNPEEIDFIHVLDFFFQIHNPTTLNQQGNDKGTSYRSAIFYQNDEERALAEEMIAIVNASERWANPVVTSIEMFSRFWTAESYHQDYLMHNPTGYTCHAIFFNSYLS